MKTSLIKDLAKYEKPREKVIKNGLFTLTNEELLAILIRTGGKDKSAIDVAREILKDIGDLRNLVDTEIEELTKFKNIGKTKAVTIKAACELGLRITKNAVAETQKIKTPEDIYNVIKPQILGKKKEYLYVISLNTKGKIIDTTLLSTGTTNAALINPVDVYKTALIKRASSIILVHNHPSNDPTPSTEDIKVTEKLAKVSKELGIPLVDHIIACDSSFVSMKSLGILQTYKI
ncbi:hypothetical protein A3K42_01115 [candidate division WWE3 bacterium RBG_13_37_7]|uniref:MPN domain-containing protein n=1 Tax=candidate division WWE3 bacterium RBG_13_37_7 TaxID=1802609 RepID=A0A1F4U173_UNCKA|nr:MAG: hypothetical protein A3K42_01115 [candidate division WWE3 bacterium RBG_13_37_7]